MQVVISESVLNGTSGRLVYGTGEMLGWLVERGIEPHIPVWERSKLAPEGKFTRANFIYDDERDVYVCQNGKQLCTLGTAHDGTTLKYIARRSDCERCPLKQYCTTGRERRLQRDVNEAARDHVRTLMGTEAYRRSARERKKIETRFGDVKWNLGLTRLRLRGLTGARDEFLLVATVQNLKRLVKHVIRPPPRPLIA